MSVVARPGTLQRTSDAISPGGELLLCCTRSPMDAATTARIRTIVGSGLNWPGVMAYAIKHRVLPSLYEGVTAAAPDLISSSQEQMLRETALSSSANGMIFVRELLRIYHLFEAAQIPLIPYKGPALAWLAYGSFVRREYTDLDFALPQHQIPAAAKLLQDAGYSAMFDLREAHTERNGSAPGQYPFLLRDQHIQIELHTERTLRYFPIPPDFEELTSRLIDIDIAGQCVHTFSIEDTLVFLCVHGTKHFWDRLAWILDVARLISFRDVDWRLLMTIAANMKSTRVLLLGLYLAHDLCGAPLPPEVLRGAMADRPVRWLAAKVREQYAGISDPSAGVWSRAVFRLRSSDEFGQGLRHLLRLTTSPTESDRQAMQLPGFLAPLYVLLRPWRLLREYGFGSKNRLKSGPTDVLPEAREPMLRPQDEKRRN